MPELPIRRMILYKHGVGYFERRGAVSGTALRLSFPREAMDDVLKSLVALDLGAGQVHGVDTDAHADHHPALPSVLLMESTSVQQPVAVGVNSIRVCSSAPRASS